MAEKKAWPGSPFSGLGTGCWRVDLVVSTMTRWGMAKSSQAGILSGSFTVKPGSLRDFLVAFCALKRRRMEEG